MLQLAAPTTLPNNATSKLENEPTTLPNNPTNTLEKSYEKVTNKTCEDETAMDSLQEAINECDESSDCRAIFDENCDGEKIFICEKVAGVGSNSPDNGCTYVKKGNGKILPYDIAFCPHC